MRTIKFRAWDKKEKRFLSEEEMNGVGGFYYNFGVSPEPDEFDLQQFTGLKDKNGKEIWEGDIIVHEGIGVNGNEVVNFEAGVFGVNGRSFPEGSDEWNWTDPEVIGNIYENPELLKAQ